MADTITPNVPIAISASLNVDDVRVLARSTETVPCAANRMDQRIGLLAIDLATHAPDIDVDDIRGGIEVKVPDVLQQHRPGYDAAFVANQILKKLKLPGKKHNILATSACGPRHQVEREIANTQDGLLDNGVTAPAKRLAAHPIVDFSECTDDQDGCGDAVVAQLTHDRDAVDIRQHAVDRDDGIVAGGAAAQGLVAAGRQVHLVTAGFERFHELTSGFRVILNDQNAPVTSRHGLPSPSDWPDRWKLAYAV